MLRVSDGQFTSDIILNLIDVTGPVSEIVGASVIQPNNPADGSINLASGGIENFISFAVADKTVYQLTLTENSVNGVFIAGQTVNISTSGTVTGVIDWIITDVNIENDGNYFTAGDALVSQNQTS